MTELADNLKEIRNNLPGSVSLVAVSKTQDIDTIREVYDAGQRVFGENKMQDITVKHPALPEDIEWHFIGHLQRNKVKYIAPFVHMIHAVDSLKLLKEINKQGKKNNRTLHCLLQFHIAEEDTKFGLDYEEAIEILESEAYEDMTRITICGVMGMATFTDNENQVRTEFKKLKTYFDRLKKEYFSTSLSFSEISMGMSEDYEIAIEEGSTMVRVGTAIFGARHYN